MFQTILEDINTFLPLKRIFFSCLFHAQKYFLFLLSYFPVKKNKFFSKPPQKNFPLVGDNAKNPRRFTSHLSHGQKCCWLVYSVE